MRGHCTPCTAPTAYDNRGRRTSVTHPAGRTSRFVHRVRRGRPQGRRHRRSRPHHALRLRQARPLGVGGAVESGHGRQPAVDRGDGTRTDYGYDRRNRLTSLAKKTAAGALLVAMTYGVDATGMRTGIEETDPAGITRTVAYTYDGVKRLTREVIDHRDAAHDRTTAWTYNRVGNRQTQSLTTAGGSEITSYTYDDNDRLLTETNTTSGPTTYTYDDNGNTTSKTTATESTTYAYDDANRLAKP